MPFQSFRGLTYSGGCRPLSSGVYRVWSTLHTSEITAFYAYYSKSDKKWYHANGQEAENIVAWLKRS